MEVAVSVGKQRLDRQPGNLGLDSLRVAQCRTDPAGHDVRATDPLDGAVHTVEIEPRLELQ